MFTTQIYISISTKTVTSKNPQDLIKSWGKYYSFAFRKFILFQIHS